MEVIEKLFDNKKYYYIGEFTFEFGTIHKFANQLEVIFCTKQDDKFLKITDKKTLNKIKKEFKELKIEDII